MASSFRDSPYRLPSFARDGVVPEHFLLPPWLDRNTIVPPRPSPEEPWAPLPFPPPGPSPFPDPSSPQERPPIDVDPSDHAPYYVVTEKASGRDGPAPVGGLLGLLQEAMRQSQLRPDAGSETYAHEQQPHLSLSPLDAPVRRLVRKTVEK
jgi:hypothetical protein